MGGQSAELTGPDFKIGVPLAEVADGAMLLGHADGEAVLVARRGEELFAIGATCTHYSGPLAEGLLTADTVVCPWHHACFSLRTGEAVGAPALNPVACWKLERRDDRFFVTGKAEPAKPRTPAAAPRSVVIVGAGAAGNAAAEMLRREGYDGPVTLVGGDPSPPVDRPNLSKDYLAGSAPEEWIPLRPLDFYREQRIDLRLGVRAMALDTQARKLTLSDGQTLSYDALLLATGAEPIKLPLPGAELPLVHYLRTLGDSRALIAGAEKARRAVVIGASFIGLEVAASLRARKLEVDVVGPELRPLERVLGPDLGDFIRGLHESHGVRFHLGTRPRSIDATGVLLENGTRLEADLVVIGVGVRPDVSLAQAAGLTVDNGIVVDEQLRTSAPGVFAAGDVARYPDPRLGEPVRIEHWVVAERMGQTAARNLCGRGERFGDVPFFWSQHYDVAISYVGHAPGWDRAVLDGSLADRSCAITYLKGDRVLAVATVGRDLESLRAEARMRALPAG